jgi:hypothetical protein
MWMLQLASHEILTRAVQRIFPANTQRSLLRSVCVLADCAAAKLEMRATDKRGAIFI